MQYIYKVLRVHSEYLLLPSGKRYRKERERVCVCERERECVCVRERESMCVCVCVRERELSPVVPVRDSREQNLVDYSRRNTKHRTPADETRSTGRSCT